MPLGQTVNHHEAAADGCPSRHDLIRIIGVWNVFQFAAATIARKRARQPGIRHFAERVWLDHAVATERLLAAAGHELVPTSLDKFHNVLLEELAGSPDDEFEPLYIAQQQSAAATAYGVLNQYMQQGEDQQLLDFCREMLQRVVLHGDMIASLTST
jgi:predicted outer membrane protein